MARRRVRLPRAAYPFGAERAYEAAVGAAIERAWGNGTERIVTAYGRALATREDTAREDARTIPGELDAVLAGVNVVWGRLLDKQAELVPVDAGDATAAANARSVVGQLGAVVAVDPIAAEPWLGPVLDAWRQSNVALIRNLGPAHAAQVEALVADAWTNGRTTEWLQKQLVQRLGVTRRRGELIARDQVGKLNGQLTMVRQSTYGITHYRWMTSMDERVRQQHADRHGERFAWASPPDDGHPGMPIQCRCVAEPDIDDALAELEREGEGPLTIGPADIDTLNRAIDELGWWMPDRGLIARLQAEAAAGIRAQTRPRDGGGSRAPRVPRQSKRESRNPREARTPRQGNPPTAVNAAGAEAAAGAPATARPPVEEGDWGATPPPGMRIVPKGTIIQRSDGTAVCEIDGITASGFEEYKGSGDGFATKTFKAARWNTKHLGRLEARIAGIDAVTPDTSTRGSREEDATEEFANARIILETPRVMRLIIDGMNDQQLDFVNEAADAVRQAFPGWRILIVKRVAR